jgi:acetyltransferase
MASKLEHLFNPRSIAVFGASQSGNSVGATVFRNLVEGEFEGSLVAVNPKYEDVFGMRCYRSVEHVEHEIDLAVIATPASTVATIIRQCGNKGIKNAIILSAGFGEAGKAGQLLRAELNEVAAQAGIRFIGPNCVGLVRPWINMNATFLKSTTPKGNLALVSQSGAICSAIADRAAPHNLGFSALVSLGNSLDTGFGDVLEFLAADEKTDAILLYVEGIRYARSFINAVRVATRSKPVIVLKAGRHDKSSDAAHTHTGALIGSDAVFDAALERAGAVRVDTYGQLFAAAEILSAKKMTNGNKLAVITNGGGAGVLSADRAGDLDIDLPVPSKNTIATLSKTLSPYWSKDNPIDILGDATAPSFGLAVEAALEDENYDGVLVMLTPQAMTDATAAAKAVIGAIPKGNTKPVLACWMGETSVLEARKILNENGIPDFEVPEHAVEAFSYLARHEYNRRLASEMPSLRLKNEQHKIQLARKTINMALDDGRMMLSDIESKEVLKAFGIPINSSFEASSLKELRDAARRIGYPVAVKINSPDISHKSDVGGVLINISDEKALDGAWDAVISNAKSAMPDATITGVTVEPMARIKSGRELVVGISKDPVFGPTILFGAGGTLVEVLKDSALSLPPLNTILAERLISHTNISEVLDKFRDMPAVNRDKIIDVLLRISDLVCELPEIEELDINPLLAGANGVVSVDARIRVCRRLEGFGKYDHLAIMPYPN